LSWQENADQFKVENPAYFATVKSHLLVTNLKPVQNIQQLKNPMLIVMTLIMGYTKMTFQEAGKIENLSVTQKMIVMIWLKMVMSVMKTISFTRMKIAAAG
jgi:hypothetical protein